MSIFYSNKSFFERGIVYNIPYNTTIHVNFSIRLLKAFNEDIHSDIVQELSEKLSIRMVRYIDGYIGISFKSPFNRSQVLAIAYRKHITRCLRTIIRYNYTNTDFLTKYINHHVTEDLEHYGGQ